jgi:WD40 repeat protein
MNVAKLWAAQLDDYVIDLAWSPDGRLLASASAAGPITLFDGVTGRRLHELSGHDGGTNSIAFAPAVASAPEASAKDADTGSHIVAGGACPEPVERVDPGAAPAATDIAPFSALLASGGQDGMVRLWNAVDGHQTAETKLSPGACVERVEWKPIEANSKSQVPSSKSQVPSSKYQVPSTKYQVPNPEAQTPGPKFKIPDSNLLAVAAGRKLLLANADGTIAHVFPDAPKTLSALAWHPQGGAIAAASFGSVALWDSDDFHVQRQFSYSGAIQALVWSPDGRWLVAGAQDNAVHLWIPDEDQEFHMSGYETKVRELSFSPDSRWLATGGARDACVWDCSGGGPDGREPLALPHSGRVCAVAFQHAHRLLATAANDGEIALWVIDRSEPRVATIKLTAPASTLAWSPDDTQLTIGSQKGGVLVLRVEN